MLPHSGVMRMLDTLAVTNNDKDIDLIFIEVYSVDMNKQTEGEFDKIDDAVEFMLDCSPTQEKFSVTLK